MQIRIVDNGPCHPDYQSARFVAYEAEWDLGRPIGIGGTAEEAQDDLRKQLEQEESDD